MGIGFGKVIAMIDDMVVLLKKEQGDDNDKKEYCLKQFDSLDDKKKGLERGISDSETAIENAESAIETLAAEIKALEDGIKALDASVAQATKQRKEENEEFLALKASDSAAKEVLGFAKNRLNKFYNPKLYVAPPKREGDSLFQAEADPGPAPATWEGGYKKKGEESNGVIAMIDMIVADVEKEIQEMEVEEKNAQ